MPRTRDVVKFEHNGRTVSGRAIDVDIKGVKEETQQTILDLLIVRNGIHEHYEVLEEDVEIIAYARD